VPWPTAVESDRVKPSSGSANVSPLIGTRMVADVCPAGMVSVPEVEAKSLPDVAVPETIE
jgi:hypothetical protein